MSDPIKKFVDVFSSLPGIGPRQATRLAFYLKNLGTNNIQEISDAVVGLNYLKTCSECFSTHYQNQPQRKIGAPTEASEKTNADNLCSTCSNTQRNKGLIAIVEKETDLISLEKTKKFNGRYLILGDLKKDGVLDSVQKLRLNSLKRSIKRDLSGQAEEIIIAINPTTYGDINANLMLHELKDYAKKISRLGRGIPTGGEIEFADEDTLGGALDNRN